MARPFTLQSFRSARTIPSAATKSALSSSAYWNDATRTSVASSTDVPCGSSVTFVKPRLRTSWRMTSTANSGMRTRAVRCMRRIDGKWK